MFKETLCNTTNKTANQKVAQNVKKLMNRKFVQVVIAAKLKN